jgi:hypothetical protein
MKARGTKGTSISVSNLHTHARIHTHTHESICMHTFVLLLLSFYIVSISSQHLQPCRQSA